MQTRRAFLRNSGLLLSATALAGRSAFALTPVPLGVQLFTVRNQAARNLPKVLDQIHRIGYQTVETFAGDYNLSAASLRHTIHGAGLRAPSGHFNYDGFDTRFNYAKVLGLDWMVCPMIAPTLWGSPEGFKTAAKKFNEWGKQAKAQGMRFAFHNHDYEFRPMGNTNGYDILINETDPELVFFEVDTYWVAQAGHDPLKLMKRLGPRLKMLHLKDRKAGAPTSYDMGSDSAFFRPVGHGSLDWKAIMTEGERLGVEHYFVEQDETRVPPVEAIRESFDYLEHLLYTNS